MKKICDEFSLIERLKSLIPRPLQGRFPIGDDAAILPAPGGKSFLFTTDAIVEDVDFKIKRGGAGPEAIGRKALAVNLSDIAAMGGQPKAFVAAFGIPKNFSHDWIEKVAKGIVRLAKQFKTQWVGGDISSAKKFFISIALLGEQNKKQIIRRTGARPGDFIYVTGTLGGSILGKHFSFIPRVREGRFLAENYPPSAMLDISDGLIQDLGHILKDSRVGAQLELSRIPVSPAAREKARNNGQKALQFALSDGEDFELLFTLAPREAKKLEKDWVHKFPQVPLSRLGGVVSGNKIEWFMKGKKIRLWFEKKGFVHF